MNSPAYVFHFAGDEGGPVDCALVSQQLWANVRQPAVVVGLDDHRRVVAGLQWHLASDGVIDEAELRRRLARVDVEAVRTAMAQLLAHYYAAFPHMREHAAEYVVQFLALGQDTATAVANPANADLMDYIKKELQPVSLAAYLL